MHKFKYVEEFKIEGRGIVKIVKPLGHYTNKMKNETVGTEVDIDGGIFMVKGIEDYAVLWCDETQVNRNLGFLI